MLACADASVTPMKVSIVIPALNEAEHILTALFSVKQQAGDFEIIVVDGGSTDRTAEIARAHGLVISSERGRSIQMNAGARQASGEALLFLHADSCLHPNALSFLRRALKDSGTVGGTFTLRFDSDKILLKLYAFFTRFRFRYFHYGDQGIFVRRLAFEQVGGFYKDLPIYFSDIVVRRDSPFHSFGDLRGAYWAYHEPTSHSGCNLVRYYLANKGANADYFKRVVGSGAHQESLRMLLANEIDGTAIDSTVLRSSSRCAQRSERNCVSSRLWGRARFLQQ